MLPPLLVFRFFSPQRVSISQDFHHLHSSSLPSYSIRLCYYCFVFFFHSPLLHRCVVVLGLKEPSWLPSEKCIMMGTHLICVLGLLIHSVFTRHLRKHPAKTLPCELHTPKTDVTHIRLQNFCEQLQFPVPPAGGADAVRKTSVPPQFPFKINRSCEHKNIVHRASRELIALTAC